MVTEIMLNKYWNKFIGCCAQQTDQHQLSQLLDLFLTHQERNSISTRVCLIEALLAQELTQREIADKFAISIAKITRGSNELKRLSEKQRAALRAILGVK